LNIVKVKSHIGGDKTYLENSNLIIIKNVDC